MLFDTPDLYGMSTIFFLFESSKRSKWNEKLKRNENNASQLLADINFKKYIYEYLLRFIFIDNFDIAFWFFFFFFVCSVQFLVHMKCSSSFVHFSIGNICIKSEWDWVVSEHKKTIWKNWQELHERMTTNQLAS